MMNRYEIGMTAAFLSGFRACAVARCFSASGAYPYSLERAVGAVHDGIEACLCICHAVVAFDVKAGFSVGFVDADGFGYA